MYDLVQDSFEPISILFLGKIILVNKGAIFYILKHL